MFQLNMSSAAGLHTNSWIIYACDVCKTCLQPFHSIFFFLLHASINRSYSRWTPWLFWYCCMFCQAERPLETHSQKCQVSFTRSLCERCSTGTTDLKMSLAGAPSRAHKGRWWQQLQRSLLIPNQAPLFLTITDGTEITDIMIHPCDDVSGIVIMEICTYIIQEKVQLCSLNFHRDKECHYVQHYTKT